MSLTALARRGSHPEQQRQWRIRRLDGFVFVAAAILVAIGLPANLGGSTTYVVLRGDSMDPTYSAGDLVVVRPTAQYHDGDIVAYEVPDGELGAGTLVVHRIVERANDRFVLQGDNNDDLDSWLPSETDIVGSARFAVPGLGGLLARMRDPVLLASLAFGASFAVMVTAPDRVRHRKEPGLSTDPARPASTRSTHR